MQTPETMPIKATLFEHQKQAYLFVRQVLCKPHTGAALLMQMGCGKSLVGVAVMGAMYLDAKINRVLIVAPLSILSVWEEELERFADFPYTITVLKGSSAKKRDALRNAKNGDELQIVIVNYESCWRLEDELLAFDADLIIADEGHKIKEGRTAQSKAMHRLGDKASYKLLLTGTVITNKEIDVFSQYRFLDKSVFGSSFFAFRNRYFDMTGYGGHTPVFKKWMSEDFLNRLHSIAFRVTKAECLDLPEIMEEVRNVELEPKAMKLYRQIEKESFAELATSEVSAVNVLTKLLRLSQITGGHLTDDEGDTNAVSTAKLDALSDIIDSVMQENKKLVIMARFVPEMNDIQRLLEQKGIDYAVIRGNVKNREEQVHRFQNDDNCRVFLGQIAAAGLGLTLTAASTIVFYSLDYSMSNFEQAKARIHRVSQKNDCLYIYLVCKGTVDTKVIRSLRNKTDLAKALVDDWRKGLNPFTS